MLTCTGCDTPNPASAKFCTACGARLSAGCASCGFVNAPSSRFCAECGAPLGASGGARSDAAPGSAVAVRSAAGSASSTPVAERRLVTVLFADLVGFTPFTEERDPEETRELLSRYFELARDAVERYGGSVEKFIGDAVMAVWGTPIAREDDAERAVRSALDLVDSVRLLGPTIGARCGVLTGEAAVTLGARDQGMVAGDLVNTAARLQSVAPQGAVLVGEATMRAASAAIAFEEAGPQVLKGKAAPVGAWIARRIVAERGGRGRSDLPEPPFVGREEELRTLKELIAVSGRDPRPRLVSVTGPGGIGKSRLAWELEKYVDGLVQDVWWHRGRSPSYGEGISFWALGEMVRRRAGLVETDDEPATRAGIATMLDAYVPDASDRAWVEPALLALLGVEPAPAGGRDALFGAWRMFFERIAAKGTTVLLFEDLQWADTGLLDFIDQVLEWSRGLPILVITLARPELFDRRPDWGSATRNLTALALQPLADPAMRALLDGFVPGLPPLAADAILARAEGMPLYAVETVRALVADGRLELIDGAYRPVGDLGELTVPDSLRSLIASRLDALDPVDRGLVQDASVLGQTFSASALSAVTGDPIPDMEPRLRQLVRRELLELDADPRSPERGQYRFVQSLIREVAYATLARRDRRARHLAVARHFETLDDPELAGALASHYLSAWASSAPGPEADAVGAQARIALRSAAERAAALGAHDQAVSHLEQALTVTTDPLERAELFERAAVSAAVAARSEPAVAFAEAAIEAARAAGDEAVAARAGATLGAVYLDASEATLAAKALESALATVPPDAHAVRARLLTNLARARYRSSESARALEVIDQALPIAEAMDLHDVLADGFNNKAAALGYLGRRREARALMRLAVECAQEWGLIAEELRARSNLAAVMWTSDPLAALDMQVPNLALAQRVGNRMMANWIFGFVVLNAWYKASGWDEQLAAAEALRAYAANPADRAALAFGDGMLLAFRGDPCEGQLAAIGPVAERGTDPIAMANLAGLQGYVAAADGRDSDAVRSFLRAAELEAHASYYLLLALGSALRSGDVEATAGIADSLDRVLDARETATMPTRTQARAGLAALDGRVAEAVAGFRSALAGYRAIGYVLPGALAALTFVRLLPDNPEARQAAGEARAVFDRVGAAPYVAMVDKALAEGGAPAGVAASARAGGPAELAVSERDRG